MNKSNRKKLTLSRESLRALQQDSLERVAGGIFESVACSYQYTCKNWQTCGWLCTYTLTKKEA